MWAKTIKGASYCIVAIAHRQKWVVNNAATINGDVANKPLFGCQWYQKGPSGKTVALGNPDFADMSWGRTVGTLPEGYVHNVPLPRVSIIQRARFHQVTKIPDYYEGSYAVPVYDIAFKLVRSAAYAFSPAWHAIAINT
jgi:hypothetical protein